MSKAPEENALLGGLYGPVIRLTTFGVAAGL